MTYHPRVRARRPLAVGTAVVTVSVAAAAATCAPACSGDTFQAADASADVSATDANANADGDATAGDGSTCAPPHVDAGAPTFCADKLTGLCADFDESPDAATAVFEGTNTRGDWTLSVASCGTYAGAGSLIAHTGLDGPDGHPAALLTHTTPSAAQSATVRFAMRVDLADDGADPPTNGGVAAIAFGSAGINVMVSSATHDLLAGVYGGGSDSPIAGNVEVRAAPGSWILVELTVHLNDVGAVTVSLSADLGDGAFVPVYANASVPSGAWTAAFAVAAAPTLLIGSFYSMGRARGWTFAVDDVTFVAP